jgi:hypothetical protein
MSGFLDLVEEPSIRRECSRTGHTETRLQSGQDLRGFVKELVRAGRTK